MTTPLEEIPKVRAELLESFLSGKTRPISYRKHQLTQLGYLVKDNAERFREALASDVGRPYLETDFLELNSILSEVDLALKNVDKWARPDYPPFSPEWFLMRPKIRKDPKGVILIISPFNFPLMLSLCPLTSAIAAGNAAVIKPSELSPATTALMAELIPKYMDPDVVRVVVGAVPETTKLLELPWDHILYTGSGRVARIILSAAAKHLTPVTTELGGKNPVFVDKSADLKLTARRLLWGRFTAAGQICVSPEYVLVTKETEGALIKELLETYKQFYNDDPEKSDSFARIVSVPHANRIKKLIDETKGTIIAGGKTDPENRYIAPTIVRDVKADDVLMADEIFGPVLSIMTVDSMDEAIAYVNRHDNPLALYLFAQDEEVKNRVFDNTRSGACVLNEVLLHFGAKNLPAGGIGPSGSGVTKGKWNFDEFTHFRSSLESRGWIDTIFLGKRFPPYTDAKRNFLNSALKVNLPARNKFITKKGSRWGLWFILTALGVVSAVLTKRNSFPLFSGAR